MSDLMTAIPSAIWRAEVQQHAFRQIMNAFSRPGEIQSLQHDALVLTLATVLDAATTLADCDGLVSALDLARLETGTALPECAQFVLAKGEIKPGFSPSLGTLESPEGGATVLLKVAALDQGKKLRLTGPGIDGVNEIAVQGLHPAWMAARQEWNAAFPLGVDVLLLAGTHIVALPRTTRIEEIQ